MTGSALHELMGCRVLRVTSVRCCVHASAVKPVHVKGPPAAFNHRSATQGATYHIVKSRYPDLIDLAEKGGAVVCC